MLKTIYRTIIHTTASDAEPRIFGHATEEAQCRYLQEYPDAQAIAPLKVTAQQRGTWRCTGRWDDDWGYGRYINAGELLRWPEDAE